jgi:DNA-binding MarR family transcriptional regulator
MSSKRKQLEEELNKQMRFVSANSVMFSQALADTAKMHSTDMECLDYLLLHGSLTAGELSKLTGLTTGAITAMIDRLEKAGYAKRQHDKDDRRKIIVVANEKKINKELAPISQSMGMALYKLTQTLTEKELETILKFMTKANDFASEEIAKLRRK